MPDTYTKPYLDACVYIAAIGGPDSTEPWKAEIAGNILQLAEDGHFQIIASTLIAAEVIKSPGETEPLTTAEESVIIRFLQQGFIVMHEVDLVAAEKARQLSREYGLKPPDAIHVATAIKASCDQLLTWDDKIHKNGRTIESVYLCEPHLAGRQGMLFDPAKTLPPLADDAP